MQIFFPSFEPGCYLSDPQFFSQFDWTARFQGYMRSSIHFLHLAAYQTPPCGHLNLFVKRHSSPHHEPTFRALVINTTQRHIQRGPLPATQCEFSLRDIGSTGSFQCPYQESADGFWTLLHTSRIASHIIKSISFTKVRFANNMHLLHRCRWH